MSGGYADYIRSHDVHCPGVDDPLDDDEEAEDETQEDEEPST